LEQEEPQPNDISGYPIDLDGITFRKEITKAHVRGSQMGVHRTGLFPLES